MFSYLAYRGFENIATMCEIKNITQALRVNWIELVKRTVYYTTQDTKSTLDSSSTSLHASEAHTHTEMFHRK